MWKPLQGNYERSYNKAALKFRGFCCQVVMIDDYSSSITNINQFNFLKPFRCVCFLIGSQKMVQLEYRGDTYLKETYKILNKHSVTNLPKINLMYSRRRWKVLHFDMWKILSLWTPPLLNFIKCHWKQWRKAENFLIVNSAMFLFRQFSN